MLVEVEVGGIMWWFCGRELDAGCGERASPLKLTDNQPTGEFCVHHHGCLVVVLDNCIVNHWCEMIQCLCNLLAADFTSW